MNKIVTNYISEIRDLGSDKNSKEDVCYAYILNIFINKDLHKEESKYQFYSIKRDIDILINAYFSKRELEETKV